MSQQLRNAGLGNLQGQLSFFFYLRVSVSTAQVINTKWKKNWGKPHTKNET